MEKETKKMPFHLTITDNRTGETVRDLDFDCLIGSAHISNEEAAGLFLTSCTNGVVAETLVSTETVLQRIQQDDPMLRLTKLLVGIKTEEEETETPEGQA